MTASSCSHFSVSDPICSSLFFLFSLIGEIRFSFNLKTCITHSFPSILCPVAFLFNWIGFFLSFCLTTSAAGRYGAISGFGLSLIKWILIVRVRQGGLTHTHYTAHIQTHKMWFYERTNNSKAPNTTLVF